MLLPLLFTLAAPVGIDLYIGTYTSKEGSRGVYRARLDVKTGALSAPELAIEAENPSYLALSPDKKTLYAVHETNAGSASAYRIGADGALSLLNVQDGVGSGPCHLSVEPSGANVLVASYGQGAAASLPIGPDGSLGEPRLLQNAGQGPNKGRQEGPHMHSINADARARFAYACDLGTDEILVYRFDSKGALELLDRTKTGPGAGPRHFAFGKGGRFAYVNNELENTVAAYAVDETGPLTAIGTLSTVPDGYQGGGSAQIVVHPSGRWLYVSNRGHDSLAVFGIGKDGTLSPVEIKTAGVREPRGFEIDPSGRWLVVAGQNSDDLLSLPISPKTGRLGAAKGKVKVPKPVCVVFRG